LHNAETILKSGAHALVAGNAIFSSENPKETISQLQEIGQNKGF
jgi:pentose-5-phosphate-3-epimerase